MVHQFIAEASMWTDQIIVTCTNKLCDSKVSVGRANGIAPNPLPPCPHCGANTLDEFAMTDAELDEFLTAMADKPLPNWINK